MAEKKDYTLDNEIDDDYDLDDIETMPAFITPPTGNYAVELTKGIETREINDTNYYNINMVILSILETDKKSVGDNEQLPNEGDMFSTLYDRSNKFAMSNFKEVIAPIAEKFGCRKIGEVIQVSTGLKLLVVVKRTYDKKSERYNIRIMKTALLD